ncbi:MAG: hypothetical protein IKV30_03260 [Clostridia bacterium]|nr:hypothetical protein [Clostridia bacterium]
MLEQHKINIEAEREKHANEVESKEQAHKHAMEILQKEHENELIRANNERENEARYSVAQDLFKGVLTETVGNALRDPRVQKMMTEKILESK